MPDIRAVVFDFGGVLFDWSADYLYRELIPDEAERRWFLTHVCSPDWNLKQEGKVEAVALAKSLGFDGVQVSIGKGTDSLPLADSALQKAYLDESKRVGLPVESLCLEILHRNFLKSDPLGAR